MNRCAVLLALMLVAAPVLTQAMPASSIVGSLTVQPVSHATLALTSGETTIFVDPVGGGEAFAGLPGPDLILITDIHGDHLDPETVAAVAREGTAIVAPRSVAERLEGKGVKVLANGESIEAGGVSVEAVPMYNLTEERAQYHAKGRGNGYVVTVGGLRVYISGDTEDIPEMRALEGIDVAFVCMNLPYTMEVEKAADAVLEFKPRVVFPYHYRGQGGMSDLEKFRQIVSRDPEIDVRVLDWYPD
ncbi:MAG: MBL fold metallo-hydrolase [Acidobacteria bacterium]|jgi:L-ascorbate metabolism protein UlaG (beta-lactamase superfamily)|nr:MBL fold metallo-hydrolase [Acidobacteriota bacterium]